MAVDIILLLIFVVCVLSGYRKGLILSLCTLLMLALSCLGAAAVQQALTPKVSEWMEAKVTSYLVDVIQDGVEDSTENALEQTGEVGLTIGGKQVTLNDLAGILSGFGLDVQESVQGAAQTVAEPVVQSIAKSISQSVVSSLAGLVIFLVAFLLIYLLLRAVSLIVNLVDRLPVVHTLNHAGGALIGAVSCALFLTVLMGLLVKSGAMEQGSFGGPVAQLLRSIAERIV